MIKTKPLLRQLITSMMISRFTPSLSLSSLTRKIIGIMADADSQILEVRHCRRDAQRRVGSCPPPHKMGGKYQKQACWYKLRLTDIFLIVYVGLLTLFGILINLGLVFPWLD